MYLYGDTCMHHIHKMESMHARLRLIAGADKLGDKKEK